MHPVGYASHPSEGSPHPIYGESEACGISALQKFAESRENSFRALALYLIQDHLDGVCSYFHN